MHADIERASGHWEEEQNNLRHVGMQTDTKHQDHNPQKEKEREGKGDFVMQLQGFDKWVGVRLWGTPHPTPTLFVFCWCVQM